MEIHRKYLAERPQQRKLSNQPYAPLFEARSAKLLLSFGLRLRILVCSDLGLVR